MSDEFDLIRRHFAPLAKDAAGAFGLTDDAATISPGPGCELVVTTDTVVSGVHVLADDHAGNIAAKLVGSNLSDLAAMGAKPLGFTLSCAWATDTPESDVDAFAQELQAWVTNFRFPLLGGDTVASQGPPAFTLTALGEVETRRALRRNGAEPGDTVFVTGTIGDGALGLIAARDGIDDVEAEHLAYLSDRYRRPNPRIAAGQALVGVAHACIDVSDGLLQDLGHIARASGVGIEVDADRIPLSAAAREAMTARPDLAGRIYNGGDDYELAFTAAGALPDLGVEVTEIGRVSAGEPGVRLLGPGGVEIPTGTGYTHF